MNKLDTPATELPVKPIANGDLIASLSRMPADVPLIVCCPDGTEAYAVSILGQHGTRVGSDVCSVQKVEVQLWSEDQLSNPYGLSKAAAVGQVKPKTAVEWTEDYKPPTGEELITASINELQPLPPNSNPFRYDPVSMATDLVRGWMIMHDGFDNDKEPRALSGMTLVNTRSGQRFHVDLTRLDTDSTQSIRQDPLPPR